MITTEVVRYRSPLKFDINVMEDGELRCLFQFVVEDEGLTAFCHRGDGNAVGIAGHTLVELKAMGFTKVYFRRDAGTHVSAIFDRTEADEEGGLWTYVNPQEVV